MPAGCHLMTCHQLGWSGGCSGVLQWWSLRSSEVRGHRETQTHFLPLYRRGLDSGCCVCEMLSPRLLYPLPLLRHACSQTLSPQDFTPYMTAHPCCIFSLYSLLVLSCVSAQGGDPSLRPLVGWPGIIMIQFTTLP